MATLQVTFVSESAAYSNTLGWYNTRTCEAGILFLDTNDPEAGTTATLDALQSDIDAGYIGFFLIPDGADRYSSSVLEGPLSFDTLGNGTGVIRDADGDRLVGAQGEVIFTDDSLNKKDVDYTLGDDNAEGILGTIAFEDLVKKGDRDFNDLVIDVKVIDENQAPVVEDQSFAAAENAAAGTVVGQVLATDADGTTLTYAIVGESDLFTVDATTGEIRVAEGVQLDFEAQASHLLTVQVSDGTLTDTATIAIGVTNVNEPLSAADDAFATAEDVPLVLSAADLLANDSDVDGTTPVIAAAGDAVNGIVALDAEGNVVFTPDEDYSGPASFSYTITDGEFSDTAEVTVEVAAVADAPVVTADDKSGVGDGAVPLAINVALADASETLGAVTIDGVPDDWTLSAGVRDETTGIYTLTADQLAGLSIDPPAGASGSLTLTVVASSSEAGDTATTTAQFTVAITQPDALAGQVIDGYVAGATVFADADDDGELDAGEASATTDANGNFTLLGGTGPLIMFGGTDVSTGLTFTGVLRAPAGSTVVTPLTTLVAALVEGGQSLAQATNNVKSALGVDASVDLLSFDPVPAAVAGDTTAAQVLAAGIQVQNIISQTSALLAGAGATDPGAAVVAGLTELVAAGAPVDLSSAATTEALISDAANATSVNVAAVIADAASVLAEANGLAADAAATADVTGLAQVAAVAQGAELTGDLGDAGAASDPGTLATDYTGANLQAQVDNAPVGDVDGALLGTIGNDVLVGGAGSDAIDGLAGNDLLDGQMGDDQLFGGPGRDTLSGGAGNDVLDGGVLADFQSAEGFIDQDRADYSVASGAVAVDLASGTASDGDGGTDTLSGIEHVTGSGFADTLTGSDAFYETFAGGAGNDTIHGGLGQDRAEYADATGAISVDLDPGSVTGDASVGSDTLIEIEQVMGSAFADHYDATGFTSHSAPGGLRSAFNSFDGLAGDDIIVGNGSTRVSYVNATAAVNVDLAAGIATGDASVGSDLLAGGVNQVRGSNFGDTLAGGNPASSAFESFEGRGGDDVVSGGAGLDRAVYAFDGPVSSGITVNLAAGTVSGDPIYTGTDSLSSIEFVQGSFRDDLFDATGFSGTSANAGSSGTFNEFEGMAGNDAVIGNANTRISYLNAREAVVVNLSLGTAIGGASVGADTVSGVSQVRGSNFDDVLIGVSHGIASQHTFEGRGGNDFINGNGGFDQAAYHNDFTSDGIVVTMSWAGDPSTGRVAGDSQIGTDTITGIASVRGTAFADIYDAFGFNSSVTGIGSFNEFDGGGGDDFVTGNGNTRLTYINATAGVTVDIDAGTATGDASTGSDTFTGVSQVRGSNHGDTLLGSAGSETFEGRGGDDAIDGRGGFDTARYDAGSGPGTFTWDASGAATASAGGQGTDILAGIEAVRGTNFDDLFDASMAAFTVQQEGMAGDDQLLGGSGGDNLLGGAGNDALLGNLGNDRLVGGAGDDTLDGGFEFDLRSAVGFNDNDRADYSGAFGPVVVNFETGQALDGEGGTDTLLHVESVTGSAFNDQLTGSGRVFESYVGGAGNDTIDGGLGQDRAEYAGGFGPITVHLASGTVTGDASVGVDHLTGVEQIVGTGAGDFYDAAGFFSPSSEGGLLSPFNSFDGLGGDDTIVGNGFTRVSYQNAGGAVTVDLENGTGGGHFSVGNDTFARVNSARGSNFADTLLGSAGDDIFEGRNGNDSIAGGGGIDQAIYSFDGPVAAGITVDLAGGTVMGDAFLSGTDTLSSVESVRGSFRADSFDATGFSGSSANAASSGTFNEFEGMAGDDTVIGNGDTRVSYLNAREAVTVNLATGIATGGASVGTDTILGGVNAVLGSDFDDTLIGRTAGQDRLAGGAGNDVLNGGILADFKSTAGFSDTDIADYSAATGSVSVDLAAGTAADGQGGADTLSGIESVAGSAHDDVIAGSNAYGEYFEGGAGDDLIDGRGGFDHADYGNATGGISVDLTAGTVTGDGSVGIDTLIDVEEIFGTGFADTYVATGYASASLPGGATTGFNSFEGGGGDDTITGSGDTRVEYVKATSAVTVDLTSGSLGDASVGSDTFVSGVSAVRGSNFNDTLVGGTDSRFESFDGWGGDDFIDGQGGFDRAEYGFHGPIASGIFVELANGVVTGDPLVTGTDTIRSVESVRGTYLADVFDAGGFGFFGANFGSNGTFNEFEGMAGDDVVFGNGNTRVSYIFARSGVTVNLAEGTATGDDSVGTDTLFGISQVRGSSFADTLIGVSHGIAQAHIYEGRSGDDFINGNGGFDQAAYNNDIFTTTGIAVDMASINASMGQVIGDSHIGTDTITGIASVRGTAFADTYNALGFNSTVTGITTFNEFDGGAGDDLITGNGNTRITYINATAGVTVDLAGTATGDASVGSDTFTGVNQVRGSNFDDTLTGTLANETFEGRNGNDLIDGGDGFDTARYDAAGAGGSFLWSGTGSLTANVVAGGQGFDTLTGIEAIRGTNFDDLFNAAADAGGVSIQGNIGNDRFVSGAGNDFFHGGFEFDLQSVIGFTDNDRVDYSAATGSVMVNLDVGVATGGGGFDTFQFVESVTGSSFDDHLIGSGRFFETFIGGAGNDTIDGAGGTDRADYSGALEGISVDMGAGIVTGGASVGTDTLINVEQLFGTSADDVYDATGALFGNSFDPLGGDDTIIGNGNTRLSYSTLGEAVTVDLGSGVVTGLQSGTDTFSGVNSVRGSNFGDVLIGTDADELFEGRSGDDVIDGGGGFDTAIFSFDGPVAVGITVFLAEGTVFGDFRNGFDTLSSIEAVRGSFQDDFFDATGFSATSGNAGSFGESNLFEGMAGNDTIIGNGSTNLSYAGAREGVTVDMAAGIATGGASVGMDSFSGVVAVLGSSFDDTLLGSDGDDAFFGGNGNDVIAGGRGADAIDLAGGGSDHVEFDEAGEGVDLVFNFDDLGGDVLDIADLLDNSTSYADGAGGALEDFLQYATDGVDGFLNVDADGTAGPESWETFAQVVGRPDLTVQGLLDSGGLDIIG